MSTFEVETRIKSVKPDGDWFRIETTDTPRLDTKDRDLAREAYDYSNDGKRAGTIVTVKGKQTKTNKDGRWFTNTYINSLSEGRQQSLEGFGGNGPQPGNLDPWEEAPSPPAQQQQTFEQSTSSYEDLKEQRIVREVAGKLAVWTLPFLPEPERTPANQIRIAEFWRAYIYGGPRAVGVAPLGGPAPPPDVGEEALFATGMASADDIPF